MQILFVAVTQCDKQYLKRYFISLWHVTKELEKKPKTNILPNLNFTSAIKLLWGDSPIQMLLTYAGYKDPTKVKCVQRLLSCDFSFPPDLTDPKPS